MNTCDQTSAISCHGAHLLIHADTEPVLKKTRLVATLRRLRSLYSHELDNPDSAPLSLQINDLQGQRVFVVESAAPLLDIPLPAGTYHVTAQCGHVCRSYTMAIEPGTTFNLYLRFKSRLH